MVFHLILTFSLTYYFCFSVCYALKILRDFKLSNISNLFFSVFIFLFLIKLFVDKESLEVLAFGLEYRLQGELGDSQSSSYNLDFIKSFLNTQTTFGTGLFIDPKDQLEWGLFSLILYVFLFFSLISLSLFLFSRKIPESALGLGLIYFILHYVKSTAHIIGQPFFIYLLFILSLGISIYLSKKGHIVRKIGNSLE